MTKPLRFAYDTEFLEDGKTIELISIGIVCEDGREYYAVNRDMPMHRIFADDWLMENVAPWLPGVCGPPERNETGGWNWGLATCVPEVKPLEFIRDDVAAFLTAKPEPVELWADYAAYDHVTLAQLFGRMIDLPEWVPMYTNDLQQELRRLGNPELPEQADGVHNALEDARHLMRCLQRLDTNGGKVDA
ncbi:3'-5' exoribonuclease domain-containing protein [Prescottella agglutinans]|uniref:3'-5' exoribonuclease Rv2179c-like domain-containing protein n=1 Tax=Prescottella agglutinans TaxID=1644129 RepID=A0ABT6MF27_9NOCA|nr:3'-5' exoribonuclease [Prescottella agglutinans]MDH6282918.1 hypothetical protein [Prescottella agglutinans]